MKDLIRKILKESDFESFDFVPEFGDDSSKDFLNKMFFGLKMSKSEKEPGWTVYRNKRGRNIMADNLDLNDGEPYMLVSYSFWKKLAKLGLTDKEIKKLCSKNINDFFDRKVGVGDVICGGIDEVEYIF